MAIGRPGHGVAEAVLAGLRLTDLTGPYYTLVLESSFVDLATWETYSKEGMSSPEWKDWYHRFSAYIENGHREIMTIVA